jgi:hypothetical protein
MVIDGTYFLNFCQVIRGYGVIDDSDDYQTQSRDCSTPSTPHECGLVGFPFLAPVPFRPLFHFGPCLAPSHLGWQRSFELLPRVFV